MPRIPQIIVRDKVMDCLECNVCGESVDKLSKDHVPPKGSLETKRLEVAFTFGGESGWQPTANAVQFRSLCEPCNNGLGKKYDHALNRMSASTRRFVESLGGSVALLSQVVCEPRKVLCSLFGHLLAAKDHTGHTRHDEIMRAFVKSDGTTGLGDLLVHYWVHTDPTVWVWRDMAVIDPRRLFCGGLLSMLAWYPLGFIVGTEPLDLPLMNGGANLVGSASVPLQIMKPGLLEEWFNTTTQMGGLPMRSAYYARYQRH